MRPINQCKKSKIRPNMKPACKMKKPPKWLINFASSANLPLLFISLLVVISSSRVASSSGDTGVQEVEVMGDTTASSSETKDMVDIGVLGTKPEAAARIEQQQNGAGHTGRPSRYNPMINGAPAGRVGGEKEASVIIKSAPPIGAGEAGQDNGENLIDVDGAGAMSINGTATAPSSSWSGLIYQPPPPLADVTNTLGGKSDGSRSLQTRAEEQQEQNQDLDNGRKKPEHNRKTTDGTRGTGRRRKRFTSDSDRLVVVAREINRQPPASSGGEIHGAHNTLASGNSPDGSNPAASVESSMQTSKSSQAAAAAQALKCRVEKNLYLDFEEYRHYSCAICYNNMPKKLFWTKFLFKKEAKIWLFDESSGQAVLPNETDIIGPTFKTESAAIKWHECCTNAIDCCIQNSIYLPKATDHNGNLVDREQRDFCPATWDGLGCWPDSRAGEVAQHPCPDNVYFLGFMPVCRGTVTKQCFSNGSWFIRNDHEWSDYSNCAPLPLYATRMAIGTAWHVISAIVIGPALIILHKFPNRYGSKRVRILSTLLFWLLLNSIMAAVHKIGIIGGIFLPGADSLDELLPPPVQPPSLPANFSGRSGLSMVALTQGQGYGHHHQQPMLTTATDATTVAVIQRQARSITSHLKAPQVTVWAKRLERAELHYGPQQLASKSGPSNHTPACNGGCNTTREDSESKRDGQIASSEEQDERSVLPATVQGKAGLVSGENSGHSSKAGSQVQYKVDSDSERDSISSNRKQAVVGSSALSSVESHHRQQLQHQQQQPRTGSVQDDKRARELSITMARTAESANPLHPPDLPRSATSASRCKRGASDQPGTRGPTQPAPVVFVCWFLSLGIRITRLLGYAWMFTGAVYLCSILHFAPAEPPTAFIKWLMVVTDAFPLTMGLTYLIARTIYEPSPLTLIVKLPYYYLIDDTAAMDELWATQLNCWMFRSKYYLIEEIADFPNFCLVILNVGLFVFTLIIMCRISRPGCTRQEMSLGDYFKAAGTLVVLYGGHYTLVAYKPPEVGCFQGQFFYYAFLFVDGIQGVAVAYVFCYKTPDGKEIIGKWLSSLRNRGPKWCQLSDGSKHHTKTTSTTCEQSSGTTSDINKSSAHSTRSNNSACNGKDVTTELIVIDENPIGSQF